MSKECANCDNSYDLPLSDFEGYEHLCLACEAHLMSEEYEEEWGRQLRLLERFTGISCNDHFWGLWHSENNQAKNWFHNICQQVSPEIYDWYTSIDYEIDGQKYIEPRQVDLFEPELPF
ncbi:hypothetical protein [Gracilimonas sediminicola]|uniref:Uncharacterized protein n=1 Tax=Gracilimonas sediminicola TaxID=2952158 RepID=A0A9X2RB24_9BACT|nr:hypothetical protein [Gracilimonas sediminicola]MCP9290021.1 hypothetical protein [Gracilimonas sediminicola]